MFDKDKQFLGNIDVNKVAFSTEFMKRRPKKISAFHFLWSFCMACSMPSFSLRSWACQLSELIGDFVSHQAIHKKFQIRHLPFLQKIFHLQLRQTLGLGGKLPDFLQGFSRVLIEDSTCIKLNKSLFQFFSGNSNGKVRKTIGRIQFTFDLLSDAMEHLNLTSYSINDGAYSGQILNRIRPGDLVIRDLGYWKLATFDKIHKVKAYFLSRLKLTCYVYAGNKDSQWVLAKELKKLDRRNITKIDMVVWVGAVEKVRMRLIGYKLTDQQTRSRKRAARQSRNKNHKITADHNYLMSWNLFVTNVEADHWGLSEVVQAYKLRWSIEMVFMNWKSNFNVDSIIASTTGPDPIRPEILMYLCQIYIASCFQPYYHFFNRLLMKNHNRILSPQKFAKYLIGNLGDFIGLELVESSKTEGYVEKLKYYYCYERRPDRTNLFELSGREFP